MNHSARQFKVYLLGKDSTLEAEIAESGRIVLFQPLDTKTGLRYCVVSYTYIARKLPVFGGTRNREQERV